VKFQYQYSREEALRQLAKVTEEQSRAMNHKYFIKKDGKLHYHQWVGGRFFKWLPVTLDEAVGLIREEIVFTHRNSRWEIAPAEECCASNILGGGSAGCY
jgi:hypothetical protein